MRIEISRRSFLVKRTQILVTLLVAALLIMTPSCGTSDSIKSLLLTSPGASNSGFYNLAGQDATLQLKVYTVYNSGKQIDVTNAVTWSVVPTGVDQSGAALPAYGPTTVPINTTGLMTGLAEICTWVDAINNASSPPAPANPPIWEYTGFYQTSASYRGFTSQPVAIGVGVVASTNSPIGGCGPS
jgi:hypothetical protein